MTTRTRLGRTPASLATGWQEYGVCRTTDPELFFPIGTTGPAMVQAEQAKAVCTRCPVREACLQWALETRQDTGVWGGLSEQEREAIHGRRLRRTSEDGRTSVQVIVDSRLDEYLALEAEGLTAWEIGRRMRTNAQTIHNVREQLAKRAEVSA
jgi:WhiB family redox-sensing transcriptional regulator